MSSTGGKARSSEGQYSDAIQQTYCGNISHWSVPSGVPHSPVRQAPLRAVRDRPRFVLCGTCHIALCLGIIRVALAAVSLSVSSDDDTGSFLLEIVLLVRTMNNPRHVGRGLRGRIGGCVRWPARSYDNRTRTGWCGKTPCLCSGFGDSCTVVGAQ